MLTIEGVSRRQETPSAKQILLGKYFSSEQCLSNPWLSQTFPLLPRAWVSWSLFKHFRGIITSNITDPPMIATQLLPPFYRQGNNIQRLIYILSFRKLHGDNGHWSTWKPYSHTLGYLALNDIWQNLHTANHANGFIWPFVSCEPESN